MKNTIRVTTVRFGDNITTDLQAFNDLSPNAQKVYYLFNAYAQTQSQKILDINIIDTSKSMNITPSEFIAAIDEINNQQYFMYYKAAEDRYVFGTSRMVY